MKTRFLITWLFPISFLILTACNDNDDDDCRYVRKNILSESIDGTSTGSYKLYFNSELQKEGYRGSIDFVTVTETTSKTKVFLEDSPERITVQLNEPVVLSGKPYDVRFSYSKKGKVTIGDNEYPDVSIALDGWMKEYTGPQTRCTIGFAYSCEISLEFEIDEDNQYRILISPMVSW